MLVDFWTYTCINWLRTLGVRPRVGRASTRIRGWSSSASTRPSSRSSTTSTTSAGPPGTARRVSDRARQRLRGLARLRQPLLAGGVHRRRRGADPAPPVRRGRLRGVRDDHPAAAARGRPRRRRRELVSVGPDGLEAQADWATLESPETYLGYEQAQDFASPGRRARRASHLHRAGSAGAQPVGARGRLDDRAAGERAERGRRADRVPLPRPRRQSRHGAARRAARRCRSGCSSTESLPATLTGSTSTRRATGRSTEPRLYQLIRAAGLDRRPHVRDHLPRAGRRGLLFHVRLAHPARDRARQSDLTSNRRQGPHEQENCLRATLPEGEEVCVHVEAGHAVRRIDRRDDTVRDRLRPTLGVLDMRDDVILARRWACRRPCCITILRQRRNPGFALALKSPVASLTFRKTPTSDMSWAPLLCEKLVSCFPVMTNADRSGSKLEHGSSPDVGGPERTRRQPAARSPLCAAARLASVMSARLRRSVSSCEPNDAARATAGSTKRASVSGARRFTAFSSRIGGSPPRLEHHSLDRARGG